jgi:selenocysteine-specific elongation factor
LTKSIVIGTAGHIDHGKSSLVRALTGTDPDRLKEEKARGITIDLGFAHASVGGHEMAFVDVPGHERFVKNMLAGVGGIDAVLLVVAADESVMPQTREHFAICRLLQIPRGVVALTKADLADADTLELARMEVRELLAESSLQDASIVPVSSRTGAGLDGLRQALAEAASTVPERSADGWPRLPVDRVFTMRGFGTVVTGTLTSGTLRVDDELVLLPSGRKVKIRGLQVHGASRPSVEAGHRVAVNLGGIELADAQRGDTLTTAGAFEVTRRFDVRLELLPDMALKHGARVRFHQGSTELLGRVALADGNFARLRLEGPAVLTRGDRFILRAYSPQTTIGGGLVVDPAPSRSPIRTPAAQERLRRLAASVGDAAMVFVEERAASGLSVAALAKRGGLSPDAAMRVAGELGDQGRVILVEDTLFPAALIERLEKALVQSISAYHAADPISDGLPREEARERLFGRADAALFDHVIGRLAGRGQIVARERLSLPGRGVSLTPEEQRAHDALSTAFRTAGLAPPDLATAAASGGVSPQLADRVSKLMLRQKSLVKLDTLLFHADALAGLKQDVAALKGAGGTARVDVAAFKDRYGISRKYAIPLLEWLDRERVTRRVGDARVIL